jgi:uncharacterized glyoxalase superfamily protein PhnB
MPSNRTMPSCTVLPELVYDDVEEAVRWLGEAFGFRVRWHAGDHRAQLQVGEGAVVVRDDPGEGIGRRSAVLVRVEDVDALLQRAAGVGARVLRGPADHPYGERQCTVEDLEGHRWTFTQSIADVVPEEWGGTTVDLT